MIVRRDFIKGASLVAMTAAASGLAIPSSYAQQVPNSTGTDQPKVKAPPNAADCHMHIYDPARFAMPPNPRVAPSNAAVPQYRQLQQRIGTTRVVVVQPRNYATDNRVTLDALAQLAPNARGVAVVTPAITDAELKAFHDAQAAARKALHDAQKTARKALRDSQKAAKATFHDTQEAAKKACPK